MHGVPIVCQALLQVLGTHILKEGRDFCPCGADVLERTS
jgi:hypothetical protein